MEFWLLYPGILFCYSKIVSSILKISSMRGKYKAFSTCVSHLSTVSLFYGTSHGMYVSSADTQNSEATAIASVMYTVVTPMVNPIVYSLRNKDVQKAVRRLMSHWASAKGSSGPPPPPGSVFFSPNSLGFYEGHQALG